MGYARQRRALFGRGLLRQGLVGGVVSAAELSVHIRHQRGLGSPLLPQRRLLALFQHDLLAR